MKSNIMYFQILAVLMISVTAWATDTIVIKGESFEGRFKAFKADRFYFEPDDGKKIHELRANVDSLTLDPVANVSFKERGKKKQEGRKFKGYEKPDFIFLQSGTEMRVPAAKVSMVDLGLDFRTPSQYIGGTLLSPNTEDFDLAQHLSTNHVTVVHWHMDGITSSMRQGNYLMELCKKNRRKAEFLRIDVKDWSNPVVKKFKLDSIPQFWFYGSDGGLIAKLTERFTDAEVDSAFKSAVRKK